MKTSNKINRYLELAKRQAWQSPYIQKHGAVLVKGGSIVNTSFNVNKYSKFATRFQKQNFYGTEHAEIRCILGIDRTITENAVLYVVRINKQGELRMSKPCSMCQNTLSFVGIKKVIYSTNENYIDEIKL